jgi:hypothetical protein
LAQASRLKGRILIFIPWAPRPVRLSFRNALRDYGPTVVDCGHHRSLEALRARDEDAETVMERIGGDPRFVRRADVLAASDHGRLDAFAAMVGNAFILWLSVHGWRISRLQRNFMARADTEHGFTLMFVGFRMAGTFRVHTAIE